MIKEKKRFLINKKQIEAGSPLPLGVSFDKQGHNFSIFSKSATGITLVVYVSGSGVEIQRVELSSFLNKTGDIWHLLLPGLPENFDYCYYVDGPNDPKEGMLFNPKVPLVDPYVKMISGLENWKNKTEVALKGHFDYEEFEWSGDMPINRPLCDTIIYELHVRGFTKQADLPSTISGTFKGLESKIPYLQELGITAVELMPIHEFNEKDISFLSNNVKEKTANFWGYSSIGFFALKASYASGEGIDAIIEFKEMVTSFHKAGIEVILDVVFNHTAERALDGDIINFRGLENKVYYHLDADGNYKNYSGCGNTMNCNHPVVRKMILDALHYWVIEMHIDGFRFDLASILSRDESGKVLSNPPLLDLIAKDPVLSKTKIIAEAWDPTGLYQVGSFPASKRWAEWNGNYRDVIRRFCLGEPGITGEVATRIAGSEDLYRHSERNPYHSINFITSHDGFTMMDLVSYVGKNNLKNGENNKDGEQYNHSQNFGVEGITNDQKIQNRREKQILNMATILMVSQGTPMILAGDEFGRTQQGNNNAWCQDNEISWVDWNMLLENQTLFQFWKAMISFRKSHPMLHRDNFFSGTKNSFSGIADISWHGAALYQPRFNEKVRHLAFLIDGYVGEEKVDDHLFVLINFEQYSLEFELPDLPESFQWAIVVDTSDPGSFIAGRSRLVDKKTRHVTLDLFSVVVMVSVL